MEAKSRYAEQDIPTLVQKISKGDREAFMTVTQLYQKKVYQLAYAFFRNHDDAMDIVQETFLRLYQKAGSFTPERNFQNWILQVARNLCIDYYRKHHKRNSEYNRSKSIDEMNLPSDKDGPENPGGDLKSAFAACLPQLSEKQRMIFVMKHYNELKYSEIAQILDIAVGTVKSLNFKAIRNLRNLLSPYVGSQS